MRSDAVAVAAAIALGMIVAPSPANAALDILHAFAGADGSSPEAITLTSAGTVVGVTLTGGANPDCDPGGYIGCGTVFQLNAKNGFRTLDSFNMANGGFPDVPAAEATATQFYGVTQNGGAATGCVNGCGTIYRLTAGGLKTIWSFNGKSAASPSTPLLPVGAKNFYGATYEGGVGDCPNGCGTMFSFPIGGTPTIIASFARANGAGPYGPLAADAQGNIYGTTYYGGPAHAQGPCMEAGCGVVFRLTPGQVPVVLHAFQNTDGTNPRGLVAGPDGNFYGVTQAGGQGNNGTVFEITPGGTFTTLAQFDTVNGSVPASRLAIAADGTIYGTTFYGGGSPQTGGGYGVIFRVSGGAITPLEDFAYGRGSGPQDLVIGSKGILYGVTQSGGPNDAGVLFSFDPQSTDPDPFSYGSRDNVVPKQVYMSSALTITGFGMPARIIVRGGHYRVASPGAAWGPWTKARGTLTPGQIVQLQVQSASKSNTATTATLTVGTVSGSFSVTTR